MLRVARRKATRSTLNDPFPVRSGHAARAEGIGVTAARFATALLLASVCAGCGQRQNAAHWDGRRGYDGNGDYGYDLATSRSQARSYRAQAARDYPVPGTLDDPWGPYIREAAMRFAVPEQWVRAVMQQESGGHADDADGAPITSSAGAMGLMQVMPQTYDILRSRYGLGGDPYEPRSNIQAGTAYIREMFDRYGAPGFLAAYNAGPDRLDAYIADGNQLPDETTNYLASVAPHLGTQTAMTGPLAFYAASPSPSGNESAADLAYAGGGMTGQEYDQLQQSSSAMDDLSMRAFDGGGLVTPEAPTGQLTNAAAAVAPSVLGQPVIPSPSTSATQRVSASIVPAATFTSGGEWGIQVGAFPNPDTSRAVIAEARTRLGGLLAGATPMVASVRYAGILYRARLVGLSAEQAAVACSALSADGIACIPVAPGT
jgi:hypothetical protein